MTNNNTQDYTPALAPLLVIAAVALGVWAWLTQWSGITLHVLGEPATLSAGYLMLASVLIAACVLFRAPIRSLLAITGLLGGFAFLWLIAQAAPAAIS
jgi:hypothetical protein